LGPATTDKSFTINFSFEGWISLFIFYESVFLKTTSMHSWLEAFFERIGATLRLCAFVCSPVKWLPFCSGLLWYMRDKDIRVE
jgi:hypothetical protein